MPGSFNISGRLTPSYSNKYYSTNPTSIPQQTVSWSEKWGNGKKPTDWMEANMDFFQNMWLLGAPRRKFMQQNYKLVNGEFNFEDYRYAIKPIESEDYGETPGELRHYAICTLPLKTIWGEEVNRPFNFRCKAEDEQATNEFLRTKAELLQSYVKDQITQELKEQGVDINTPQGQQMAPPEIEEYMKRKYSTTVEKASNSILNKLMKELQLREKFQKGWKDATIVAQEIYWTGTLNGQPVCETVNPLNVVYDKSYDVDYLDQCEWVTRGEYMAPSQIIDRYSRFLSTDQVESITTFNVSGENNVKGAATGVYSIDTGNSWATNTDFYSMRESDVDKYPLSPDQLTYDFYQSGIGVGTGNAFINSLRHILVTHAEWMGKLKMCELTYFDEDQQPQKTFLDGEFKLDQQMKDAGWSVEYFWINQAWEGTRIGRAITINVKPKTNQYRSPNKVFGARLGYTGTIYNNRNALPTSILDEMKPMQMYYNIIMHKLECDFNKEMGKLLLMSINQIPSKKGWNTDKWLWYAKNMGVVLIDESAEGTTGKFNQFNSIDATLGNAIEQKIQMLEYLENKCFMMAGVNAQRMAKTTPGETATANNIALQQSYAQTEDAFRIHNNVKTRVLANLLEEAKVCYADGLTTSYFLDDLSTAFIKIDGKALNWADLNVYCTDSAKDQKMLATLEELAKLAIQSGTSISEVGDMLTTDSIAEIREKLDIIKQSEEAYKQQQLALEQQKLDQQQQQYENTVENENVNKELDRQKDIYVAEIRALGMAAKNDPAAVPDLLDQENLALDKVQHQFEVDTKNKELDIKDRESTQKLNLEKRKVDLKQQEIDSKNKIAKDQLEHAKVHTKLEKQIANKNANLQQQEINIKKKQLTKKPKPK